MFKARITSQKALIALTALPLSIIGILSITVLLPALGNPESKMYASAIGYPAFQRLTGQPIKVQVAAVEQNSVDTGVAAPGEAEALLQVDIRPLVSGTVEKVYVVEGQYVKKGQPLVLIEQTPFLDKVEEAENNVAIARANTATLKASKNGKLEELEAKLLSAQGRASNAKDVDSVSEIQVRNNVATARTRLESARIKLEQAKLLVEQGAFSKYQLYDAQDIYAARLAELQTAQEGSFGNTTANRYVSREFRLTREAELASAQQALDNAKASITEELDNSQKILETQQLRLEAAKRDLSRTVVRASTDGLVSQVNIHSGELGDRGDHIPLLTLSHNVVFRVYVDQSRLNDIKANDPAVLRFISYPGKTFSGKVIRVNPTVETNATRNKIGNSRQFTYSVWVAVEGTKLTPGLQGFAQFNQGKLKSSMLIPESAVTHLSAGEGMVMVAEYSQAVIRKVQLGKTFNAQREVIAGLKFGELVVLSPRALNPGDKLDVQITQHNESKNKASLNNFGSLLNIMVASTVKDSFREVTKN